MSVSCRPEEAHERGFTLVELLVVIVIIGILAAITIPVFLSQRQKAYDATAKSDIHTAALAEESYFAAHGQYTDIATAAADQDLRISKGTSIVSVFVNDSKGFCLGAIQAGGSPLPASQAGLVGIAPSIVWWYDSSAGGLQPRNAALSPSNYGCPTTNSSNGAAFAYQTFGG